MKTVKRRMIAAALLFVLLLLAVRVGAAGAIDPAASCSLTIRFMPGGAAAPDVPVAIYRVASVSTSCSFTPTAAFAGYPLVRQMLAEPSTAGYRRLSQTLPGLIAADAIVPDAQVRTDRNGIARAQGLAAGLYLVTAGIYDTGSSLYEPQAFMICLPQQTDDTWQYDAEASVKWSRSDRTQERELTVRKVWADGGESHSADSITVELYCDGRLYDTCTLSDRNQWRRTWSGLAAGCVWTVREALVPEGYLASVERYGTQLVITNTKLAAVIPEKPRALPMTGMDWSAAAALALAGAAMLGIACLPDKRKRS